MCDFTCSIADLHSAFVSKDAYFFVVLSLSIVSSLFYCLASVVDPGYLPKPDITKDIIASFNVSSKKAAKVSSCQELAGGRPELGLGSSYIYGVNSLSNLNDHMLHPQGHSSNHID